jgi:hypothetical protein
MVTDAMDSAEIVAFISISQGAVLDLDCLLRRWTHSQYLAVKRTVYLQ